MSKDMDIAESTYTADKTYSEILSAINDNKIVIGVLDEISGLIALSKPAIEGYDETDDSNILFFSFVSTPSFEEDNSFIQRVTNLAINESDEVYLYSSFNNEKEDSDFVVEFSSGIDTMEASKTFSEIHSAELDGQPIKGKWNQEIYTFVPDFNAGGTGYVFYSIIPGYYNGEIGGLYCNVITIDSSDNITYRAFESSGISFTCTETFPLQYDIT